MQNINIAISGMSCKGCANSIKNLLIALEGVNSAEVDFDQSQANINFNPQQISIEEIISAIESAGFDTQIK